MHFSLLYITFALPLLTSSAPLHGDNQIDRAMTISPQAIKPTTPIIKNRATQKKVSSGGTTSTSHQSTPTGSRAKKPSTSCSSPNSQGKGQSNIENRATDDECDSEDDAGSVTSISSDATVEHLSGREDIILFHGIPKVATIDEIKEGVKLSKAPEFGYLHDKHDAIDGAFYMTDSVYAAAQHACQWSINSKVPKGQSRTVSVAEFQWLGTGMKVREFKDVDEMHKNVDRIPTEVSKGNFEYQINPAHAKIMVENDMITSPLLGTFYDYYLTGYFWQYAVLKQKVIDDGKLKFKKSYTFYCDNVKVRHITGETYTNGQKTDATIKSGAFDAMVDSFAKKPTEESTNKDVWVESTFKWMSDLIMNGLGGSKTSPN